MKSTSKERRVDFGDGGPAQCVEIKSTSKLRPPGFNTCPGSIEGVAANRVKHHLDVLDVVLEAIRCVADDFVGAKLSHKFRGPPGSRSYRMGAVAMRQLNGGQAYRACRSVNQDRGCLRRPGPARGCAARRMGEGGVPDLQTAGAAPAAAGTRRAAE